MSNDTNKIELLKAAAEQGDAKLEGAKDAKKEAFQLFKKAAKQGHANAQNSLGMMYENGEGVDKNKAEAIKWFKEAAKQGHEEAKSVLEKIQNESEAPG